jgi:hypothetical protein
MFFSKSHVFVCFLGVFCLLGGSAIGQSLLQKQVSVDAKNKRLSEVLAAIGRQGNFYFSYNSNIIRKDSIVSLTARGKTVKEVLDMLLGEHCQYVETDKYVILQPTEREKWYTISGFITDGQTGDALPDVTVFERQQLVAAITGKDGFFKLQLKDREKYRSAEITVSKGFYIDTSISLIKGYDQEVALTIVPEVYSLPGIVVTQHSGMERSWLGKLLVSSKLKTQNLNLGKFFVDKPYQFSLVPGLGTHGKMSGQVANKFSLNVLGGYSAGVEGFEVAGLFNIDKKDVQYVQTAGIFNIVLGNTKGAQVAGVSNFIEGKATGAQCAGVINKAGKVDGAQVGGVVNIAFDTVNGAQASGFVNAATVANTQIAGFVNIAEHIDGIQIAGFINLAERINGMQLAGFINLADQVDGMQLAGFVNIAGTVKGVQMAGFINIADSCDYPIGLVNIVGNGDASLGVTVDDLGTTTLSLRSGGRILYGIVGIGVNAYQSAGLVGVEAGLGAHIPISRRFRINTEFSSMSRFDFGAQSVIDNGFRVLPAMRLGRFEVFAGGGINISFAAVNKPLSSTLNTRLWEDQMRGGDQATIRVAALAGIQFRL